MRFPQIITHLTDNDLYKYTMFQTIYNRLDAEGKPLKGYSTVIEFANRGDITEINEEAANEIREQLYALKNLRYTKEELAFLGSIEWIKPTTIEFLRNFRMDPDMITVDWNEETGLSIKAEGPWAYTIWWEIYALAITSEVRTRMLGDYDDILADYKKRTDAKLETIGIHGNLCIGNFSEFGTRRRLSFEAQEYVIQKLATMKYSCSHFVGTSNVYFAMKYGLKPVGTMAHEYIMGVGQGNQMHNPAYSNWYAMNIWYEEYGTMNGIMLPDTLGRKLFFLDFNKTFARVFDGLRHDSGNPFEFGEDVIAHYKKLGFSDAYIKTKTLLFSDGLNFKKADEIFRAFNSLINVAFGIGTFLTNDSYIGALNAVMKMTWCNGYPVAKMPDTEGKIMCPDKKHVEYVADCMDRRFKHVGAIA